MSAVNSGFETIRNNTALKLVLIAGLLSQRFETIRNNTALKLGNLFFLKSECFETIRNNTALKRLFAILSRIRGF